MAHHAYFVPGGQAEGLSQALRHAGSSLGLTGTDNPDIITLTYGLFSVEDARKLTDTAYRSSSSGRKVIIASTTRLFHEAQNAMLKVFEEPPEGVTIILNIPSEGMLLPTLRSRLLPLPVDESGRAGNTNGIVAEFLAGSPAEREKLIAKLVDRTKSDKDEVKQAARHEAVELLQGLTVVAYPSIDDPEYKAFLEDLATFMPLMYERSAPIKLIFEHLLLVIPKGLGEGDV